MNSFSFASFFYTVLIAYVIAFTAFLPLLLRKTLLKKHLALRVIAVIIYAPPYLIIDFIDFCIKQIVITLQLPHQQFKHYWYSTKNNAKDSLRSFKNSIQYDLLMKPHRRPDPFSRAHKISKHPD